MATLNGLVVIVLSGSFLEINGVAMVSLLLSLQMEFTSLDFVWSIFCVDCGVAGCCSDSMELVVSDTWNGFVVCVVVTATGETFKNGLVDDFVVGLLDSALNSALKILTDGTLIFSIVPRFSEKCVTVTVSVVFVVTPFTEFDVRLSKS